MKTKPLDPGDGGRTTPNGQDPVTSPTMISKPESQAVGEHPPVRLVAIASIAKYGAPLTVPWTSIGSPPSTRDALGGKASTVVGQLGGGPSPQPRARSARQHA